jgi:hypothetical protein
MAKEETLRKFTRVYKHNDGVIATWTFDLDKTTHGPIEVNLDYPKDYNFEDEVKKRMDHQNKIDKKYLNPNNGKYVGYGRAKALGLI